MLYRARFNVYGGPDVISKPNKDSELALADLTDELIRQKVIIIEPVPESAEAPI